MTGVAYRGARKLDKARHPPTLERPARRPQGFWSIVNMAQQIPADARIPSLHVLQVRKALKGRTST